MFQFLRNLSADPVMRSATVITSIVVAGIAPPVTKAEGDDRRRSNVNRRRIGHHGRRRRIHDWRWGVVNRRSRRVIRGCIITRAVVNRIGDD